MPFTQDDLDRIRVRAGMSTKSLRQLSDTQFTAWLRAQGARGEIGVVKLGPGELMIPIEERVRVLNDLERDGFYIPDIMGTEPAASGPDPALLARALEHLTRSFRAASRASRRTSLSQPRWSRGSQARLSSVLPWGRYSRPTDPA